MFKFSASAVSVVEFDYCVKHGSPVSLRYSSIIILLNNHKILILTFGFEFSEQQVADCSSTYGNAGCNGGWQANVWQYVAATGGLDTGASYPYTSGDSGIVSNTISFIYQLT